MDVSEFDDLVLCDRTVPFVAVLTINRPALNTGVKSRLNRLLEELNEDTSVRVVVITGAGGNFVAGTDIAEMSQMTPTYHAVNNTGLVFHTAASVRKPVIAAVEGYALGGGCELALACDMIVAGRSARFGQPEICVGIMPGAGGAQRLVRTVGKYRAMKMILTGGHVEAEIAMAMGMLTEIADDGNALSRSIELATRIAEMPPLAVGAIKEVVTAGQNMPLDAAIMIERKAFQGLFDTIDQKEGMLAFLERRTPVYRGC